jgi:hypothetical protein
MEIASSEPHILAMKEAWSIKMYWLKRRIEAMEGHMGPPSPHWLFTRHDDHRNPFKTAEVGSQQDIRQAIFQTVHHIDQYLESKAEKYCRIQLPPPLPHQAEEIVYDAVFFVVPFGQAQWQEALKQVQRDTCKKGLILEVSGPWPSDYFLSDTP